MQKLFEQNMNTDNLGIELNEQGFIKVDGMQKTSIPEFLPAGIMLQ
jgi:pyruvate/2-oxoglutarate dehydrogenase complex dihydrolipoamide dehydrogenase (E3) component